MLIDFLQGRDAAAVEIDRYDDPCYSVISWMEVMINAETDAERFTAETLFESMRRIDLSADIARRAVGLRRQLRLKLPDAILLATADREGCILVTRNAKDFDADDPRVRIPYQLRELLAEKALQRSGMARSLAESIHSADTEVGRERVRSYLESQPFPHFEAEPRQAGDAGEDR